MIDHNKLSEYDNGLKIGAALIDSDLSGNAKEYKKNVASRYKLLSEGDLRTLPDDEYFTSLKYDGQLHFLYKKGDEIFLYNPRGRISMGLSLLDKAADALSSFDEILLAGELYMNNNQSRSRVYEVTSALGADSGEAASKLCFGAFNILKLNGESRQSEPFKANLEWLQENLPAEGEFHLIEHKLLSKSDIGQLYNDLVVDENHEGLVCTSTERPLIYKVKPRHNIDAVIIGFTERPDEPGTVRVVLTALMRPDGSYQIFSKVGGGFDEDTRRDLFRKLKDDIVESEYKEADRNYTLFNMVKPQHVIEISFHDLITENSSGKAQMKAVLNYEDNAYKANLPEKFVTVLAPVFKRFREDKEANPEDIRITQLRDLVDLDNLEDSSRQMDLAKSEIIDREVYTKTTKDIMSVRKFICWKTNKEDFDDSYPPYAFCYVDYSPGRRGPLKKVLRTAQSAEELAIVYNSFKEKEIKKGWELAE